VAMSVIQEIADWTKSLPVWQSDAVRRIFTQDELSAEDEDDLLKMLLAANGIVDKESPASAPVPFPAAEKQSPPGQRQVVLKELHTVVGVNALVADQALVFALDGLTIIYGENGAGKSGYSRVLKHSCHAREKSEPILPNVTAKTKPLPSAVIELAVDGQDVAVQWKRGMAASEHLIEIAVFDSHCARVFLDDANEVVYLPYGSDVFSKLSDLLRRLKEKIKASLATIPQRLAVVDEFSESSAAGRFVRTITDKSDPNRIDVLGRLDDKEKARLELLRTLVATAKVNPPKQQAAQLRRRKSRLDQLKQRITLLDAIFNEPALTELKRLDGVSVAAAKAAVLASTEAFKDDPIDGTGSDAWRLLFDAAKTFSTTIAFPDRDFPVVDSDAACLLCQQPLSEPAKSRFLRFQEFVTNDAAKRKTEADTAFQRARNVVAAADVGVLLSDPTVLTEVRAVSEDLATLVDSYFVATKLRKDAIARACIDHKWETIPPLVESPVVKLTLESDTIETAAVEFDKADDPETLRKLELELSELSDRERLSKYSADFKAFLNEKLRETSLRECDKSVDTSSITRFGSDLIARAVTEQLETRLAEELRYFSVQSVPLLLKKTGERGKTKHQLTITSDARPSGVLSEGEQRVVAIASFLAELNAVGHSSPIVFDDPVSSLDHLYREKVAARLVKESSKRQVVIFTHDITLLLALERECGEQQTPLLVHTIRRSANGPGECAAKGSKPWHCQSTNDRIGHLKQECSAFKKLHSTDPQEFERKAKEVYGKLRESWERAIEEVVLNGVIGRFDPAVQTKRLRGVCMVTADYAIIDREMSKCSTRFYGHDTAPALSLAPLSPEQVEEDVKALETFVKELRERQKKAIKEADTTVEAPKARVADKRALNLAG